jgi:hypothetical protein
MRIGTSHAGATALVAVCLLLSACGSGSDSSRSEPEIGAVPVVNDTAELSLPLDRYGLTPTEYSSVRRAAWRLTRDCVREFGGEYTLPESALTGDAPLFDHPHERRYGIYDERSASVNGYNLPPDKLPPNERSSVVWNPSAAETLLVRGPAKDAPPQQLPTSTAGRALPEGGCQADADRILGAGTATPPNQNLSNELAYDANQHALGDSRVAAAMKRWSDCMAARGYHYETPWDPNKQEWPEPATAEEIATAVADVRCKHETNLLGAMEAVEAAYHERVIRERAGELDTVRAYNRALLTNAAPLLG